LLEIEAKKQAIHKLFTDTYAFQVKGFYEKQGYKVIAVVPGYMLGHDKIYLKKEIE
jgi:hypothetical protein